MAGAAGVPGQAGEAGLKAAKRGKKLKIVLVTLLALIAAALIAFGFYVNSLNQQMALKNKEEAEKLAKTLAKDTDDSKPFYMLVLGSDARKGDKASRSDVITLIRVDEKKGTLDLISIPRDTAINMGSHDVQKINAAYAIGGAAYAVQTVSEFAGVPITHFVEVNFEDLIRIVDEIGGITVNLPEGFNELGVKLDAGTQTLNGEQALAFARERHQFKGGDFSRAQSQRIVMTAIIKKILKTPAQDLPGVISKLASSISTDMNIADVVQLAESYQSRGIKIYSAACPSYAYMQNGVSYVGTMYVEWREMMQRVDAGLNPNDTKAKIPAAQKENKKLGAATNAASPHDYEQIAKNALNTDSIVQETEPTGR